MAFGSEEDSESSSEDSLTGWELRGEDWECARPNSSANLDSPNGWFTSASLSYQLPCTATEGTTCQIVAHLSAWNKVLWLVSWQLLETPGMAGKLSLVSLDEHVMWKRSPQKQCLAMQHACWLLKTHRCVTHVEWDGFLPFIIDDSLVELLVDAIRASEFITSVKLYLQSHRDKDLASAVLSLPHLVEVELVRDPDTMLPELPTFLQGSTSLTALRLPHAYVRPLSSEDFFRAVGQNSSLKELVLSSVVIFLAPPTAQAVLTEWLKNSTSLTSLTVASYLVQFMPLGCILEGLVESRSVLSVDVTCPEIGHADVQLISQIFEHNSVLQSFRIARDPQFYRAGFFAKVDSDCCLKALVGNRTLEQVTLPMEVSDEGQWKELFEALPSKRNLRKVVIGVPKRKFLPLLGKLCVALKGTAAEEKVAFDCPFDIERFHENFMCKAFSSVTLSVPGENKEAACGLLDCMPSLGHITSMHLSLHGDDDPNSVLFSALTTFLGATRSLKTLTLSMSGDDSLHYWQDTVLQGLAVNTSLRKLEITVRQVSGDFSVFVNPLAATISTSKNICRVYLHTRNPRDVECTFLQRLSTTIADNYNLLSVTVLSPTLCSETAKKCFRFKVLDTTRRNCGLLTAAADFARGARHDRYCALALDRMRDHPELVEEVARLEKVDEARAATMVCDGLRRMEGMDDFMRFAGVVKERVSCHPREDGRTQLDALNEYCWSAVRRYLKLYDIGDTTGTAPPY